MRISLCGILNAFYPRLPPVGPASSLSAASTKQDNSPSQRFPVQPEHLLFFYPISAGKCRLLDSPKTLLYSPPYSSGPIPYLSSRTSRFPLHLNVPIQGKPSRAYQLQLRSNNYMTDQSEKPAEGPRIEPPLLLLSPH